MVRFAFALSCCAALLACNGDDSDTLDTTPFDAGADGGPKIILDGGGTVPQPPDGASACPSGACNYQTGDGCSGAAPSCVPTLDANGQAIPGCQPAGAGTSGTVCAASAECAPGYLCADKTCHKLCCGGDWSSCPSDEEHCIQSLKLAGPNDTVLETGAMLCFPVNTCDALAPATCTKPGTSCQIVDPTGATACATEGTGETGEPCPCKGGFLCKDPGGAGPPLCRRLCKAVVGGGEPSCPPGEGDCVHYASDPPGVGECTP